MILAPLLASMYSSNYCSRIVLNQNPKKEMSKCLSFHLANIDIYYLIKEKKILDTYLVSLRSKAVKSKYLNCLVRLLSNYYLLSSTTALSFILAFVFSTTKIWFLGKDILVSFIVPLSLVINSAFSLPPSYNIRKLV